jgi:hypothetical protein
MGEERRESGWGVEGRVGEESEKRGRGSAKVQIGRRPVQRWKSELNQSTEYRVQRTESKKGDGEGRRCKGPNQPSGCAKVERLIPKQSTEYRVQSTEER